MLQYKKATVWSIAAAFLVVLAVGAGLVFNHTSGAAKEPAETVVTFPAYQGGKNEYNYQIYEHTPFTLRMKLPKGWKIKELPEEKQEATTPWTPMQLWDTEGRQVGFVGFGVFEDVEGVPQEEYYKVAFSEIRLGSVISWCNEYTPVRTEEEEECAVCQIYRSENGTTEETPAIVAYNRRLNVYIAMSLEADSVTEEELREIAESIRLEEVSGS